MPVKLFIIVCFIILSPSFVIAQAPPVGFVPPPLNPEGVTLSVKSLGNNVYALLSSKPPVDNAGFVVGEDGVLVIDAHINEKMANQIIDAVRSVTDKPILYLVNTNGHADHTFGNYAFPAETKIIAHKLSKIMMSPEMKKRKQSNLILVAGDVNVFDGVEQRLPDLTFDKEMEIDLGGISVELHHFGAGNTYGDTVVYVPAVKAAWTGNMVFGESSLPFLLIGDTVTYVNTLNNFAAALDVDTIVPGHGLLTTSAIFNRYTDYLETLETAIIRAKGENLSLEQTINSVLLDERFSVPNGLSSRDFYHGLHPFNVQKIYLEKNVK